MGKKILKITAIVGLVVAMGLAIPANAKKNQGKPKIEFKEEVYDFGKVSVDGGSVVHEFLFTNTGKSNLVIVGAHADCGCTKPQYSEEPIAPGKTGSIKVTFVPNGRGNFTKKVTVVSNGEPRRARLLIKGEVVR